MREIEGIMFRYTMLLAAIALVGYGTYRIDEPIVYVVLGCFWAWLLAGWNATRGEKP